MGPRAQWKEQESLAMASRRHLAKKARQVKPKPRQGQGECPGKLRISQEANAHPKSEGWTDQGRRPRPASRRDPVLDGQLGPRK